MTYGFKFLLLCMLGYMERNSEKGDFMKEVADKIIKCIGGEYRNWINK